MSKCLVLKESQCQIFVVSWSWCWLSLRAGRSWKGQTGSSSLAVCLSGHRVPSRSLQHWELHLLQPSSARRARPHSPLHPETLLPEPQQTHFQGSPEAGPQDLPIPQSLPAPLPTGESRGTWTRPHHRLTSCQSVTTNYICCENHSLSWTFRFHLDMSPVHQGHGSVLEDSPSTSSDPAAVERRICVNRIRRRIMSCCRRSFRASLARFDLWILLRRWLSLSSILRPPVSTLWIRSWTARSPLGPGSRSSIRWRSLASTLHPGGLQRTRWVQQQLREKKHQQGMLFQNQAFS